MKFRSKYSNNKLVSPAQYITELICENKAKIDKKDLHFKFWLNKEWAIFYKNQIATANKLLKTYEPEHIIRALKTFPGQKIYSLRAPHLSKLIEKEKNQANKIQKTETKPIERNKLPKIKTNLYKKPNILDTLKDTE